MRSLPYVDMRWNIALHSGISIDQPGATDITSRLEDLVLNDISHFGEPMLELMSHH